jgi:hypothetical protein
MHRIVCSPNFIKAMAWQNLYFKSATDSVGSSFLRDFEFGEFKPDGLI